MNGARHTTMRLETSRLTLEPLSEAHADALYALYTDSRVSRFLFTKSTSREEFDAILRHSVAFGKTHGMWAVISNDERKLIGRIGFYAFGEVERPELAFLLASNRWGLGYATEACRVALCHACQLHSWREVVAIVQPANAPAIRVLTKLGFAPEAEFELKENRAVLFATDAARFSEADESVGFPGRT